MYKNFIKRFIDIFLSIVGIAVLAIPMLVVGVLIKIEDGGPVFFIQRRIGRGKKEFSLYKFRTMKINTPHDMPTHLLKDPGQYLMRFGKLFRRLSIDELPQLINILKGDMSVVGPRPALFNQEDLILERDKYNANSVRPGLTGWAQINGRDELKIPIKAAFDGEYVKKISFWFDCRCFFGTFLKVFNGSGVIEGGIEENKTDNEKNTIL